MLKQLSLFVENRPGALNEVCQTIAQNKLSILTLSLADTAQFGILRLLVNDWKKAQEVLSRAGFVTNVTDVVAIPVPDRPGGLADTLAILDAANVQVEYMYALTFGKSAETAVMIFRFEDPEKAVATLRKAGIESLESFDTEK